MLRDDGAFSYFPSASWSAYGPRSAVNGRISLD